VKIAKITAVYTAANLLKLIFSNSRKMYILGKIHTTMTSRSHIPPVSKGKGKVNIFVLNSHSKLQIVLIKNKIFLLKRKTTAFCQKTRRFGKITAFTPFDENTRFP